MYHTYQFRTQEQKQNLIHSENQTLKKQTASDLNTLSDCPTETPKPGVSKFDLCSYRAPYMHKASF